MTEASSKLPTARALAFAAARLKVTPSALSVYPVTGGYSLNRRAIVGARDAYVFVKEVDDTLVAGDGELERSWLAKDHGLVTALRKKGEMSVSSWSELSSDRAALLLPAYRPQDGWVWSLPDDARARQQYITAVLGAEAHLAQVSFTSAQVEDLSLEPYFRQKIAESGQLPILDSSEMAGRIAQRCGTLLAREQNSRTVQWVESVGYLLEDKHQQTMLKTVARQLAHQPDAVFGHCDLRTDNLAYHAKTNRVVLVDWNWASYAPKGFGATEFLISVEREGVDTSPWNNRFNLPLVAGMVGFWLEGCTKPDLDSTSSLRDDQLIAAGCALTVLKRNSYL